MSKHSKDLLFLDGLRGLAAMYVMVGHARWLLWEGYGTGYALHPEKYSLTDKIMMWFFTAFKFGHEAVLLFFVLSGFVIHLRYARNIRREGLAATFDFKDYFIRRLRRLYPPFLFAILITTLFDRVGVYLQLPIYFQHTAYETINANVNPFSSVGVLLLNLVFLMRLVVDNTMTFVPTYGTDGPLWSLAMEWWFYMIYPIFFVFSRRSVRLTLLLVLGIYAMYGPMYKILIYDNTQLWTMPFLIVIRAFTFWWFGVILADIYTHRLRISFGWVAWIFPVALVFMALKINNLVFGPDLYMAMSFMGIIAFLFWLQDLKITLKPLHWVSGLGSFSYSLYVIHVPILVFMGGLIMKYNGNLLPMHSWWVFVGMAVSVAFAYLAYILVEKPFMRIGKKG